MKKFLSVFLAVVLVTASLCTAYAAPTIEIYDFDGNRVENPDLTKPWLYGAVFNPDGTMAPQPRDGTYVDDYITLSAGQTWTSYQYKLSNCQFAIGVNNPSMAAGDIYMAIQKASSVGGTKSVVKSTTVKNTVNDQTGIQYKVGSTATYLNGQFKNKAATSSTFKISVGYIE